MRSRTQRRNESGNILFYILIAVILLAALSYAVTRNISSGANQMTTERARMAATEILEYANSVANAAAQLRLRGCKLTELSFEGASGTYTNASTPGDNTCKIFHASGGGVEVQSPPEAALVTVGASWAFSADMAVNDIGTTCTSDSCADLLAYLPGVKDEVCDAVNAMTGIDTPTVRPSQNAASFGAFQGTYTYVDMIGDQAGTTKLSAKNAGCFHSAGDDANIVYKVLIAR